MPGILYPLTFVDFHLLDQALSIHYAKQSYHYGLAFHQSVTLRPAVMPLPSHKPWLPSTKRYFEKLRISSCIPNEYLSKHKLTIKQFQVTACLFGKLTSKPYLQFLNQHNRSFLSKSVLEICHFYGSLMCKDQPLNRYFIQLENRANRYRRWWLHAEHVKQTYDCAKNIRIACTFCQANNVV